MPLLLPAGSMAPSDPVDPPTRIRIRFRHQRRWHITRTLHSDPPSPMRSQQPPDEPVARLIHRGQFRRLRCHAEDTARRRPYGTPRNRQHVSKAPPLACRSIGEGNTTIILMID
jgi:hypothetical protein